MSKDSGGRLWSGLGRDKERPADAPTQQEERRKSPPAEREYVAFDTHDRAERLHIHRATQPSRFPSYNYLLDIIYDHDFQSLFTLVYSFMAVEVTGENLGPIVHAISLGTCECIREFHRKLYDPPPKGTTRIEAIKITTATEEK